MSKETLHLYDIPKGSKIKVDEGMITFHHLDGMYSYCTADWLEKDNVIHLRGGTPLIKVEDYYEIDNSSIND